MDMDRTKKRTELRNLIICMLILQYKQNLSLLSQIKVQYISLQLREKIYLHFIKKSYIKITNFIKCSNMFICKNLKHATLKDFNAVKLCR